MSDVTVPNFFKKKNNQTTYVILGLIVFVLILIYFSSSSSRTESDGYSSDEEDTMYKKPCRSCGCDPPEGIQYAKRVPSENFQQRKEGLKTTYEVQSPALKSMFEEQQKEKFTESSPQMMKTSPVSKTLTTKAVERFSSDFAPPVILRSSGMSETVQSPFYGPINL